MNAIIQPPTPPAPSALGLTGSSAPRISHCASAGLLGGSSSSTSAASEAGAAGHAHIRERLVYGVDEAWRRWPELLRRYRVPDREGAILTARLRKFGWCPPRGALCEVALVLRADGTAERTTGGQGHYPALPADVVIPCQLDCMWSEPEPLVMGPDGPRCPPGSVLYVVDLKFGQDRYVAPVEKNIQLAAETVAAAAWTGATEAIPAVLFVSGEQGDWDTPEHAWGPRMLAAKRDELFALRRAREQAAQQVAAGTAPPVHEGPWCVGCPSFSACPAKLSMLRAILADQNAPQVPAPLDAPSAARLVVALRTLETATAMARTALRAHVESTGEPIDMGDGLAWGPVVVAREEITGGALPVLAEELGMHMMDAVSISKAGIEDGVRAMHEDMGIKRQRSPAMRRILARLHETGAIISTARTEYRLHRVAEAPKPAPAARLLATVDPTDPPGDGTD